jgi:hypothetical protein
LLSSFGKPASSNGARPAQPSRLAPRNQHEVMNGARSTILPQLCEDGIQITHFETAIAPLFGRPRALE